MSDRAALVGCDGEWLPLSRRDLLSVEKPARYLGGEWNQAKPKPGADFSVCLAYPDLYELGMSNLGLKILYDRLDRLPTVEVERVFSPWIDFEAVLRRRDFPLFSLERHRPLSSFDLLGITLPYEMTFTNVWRLLEMGRIAPTWRERRTGPWVIGGGPSASNPWPVADVFDAILIGDGEEALPELIDLLRQARADRQPRDAARAAIAGIRGFFVPARPGPVRRRVWHGFAREAPPVRHPIAHIEAIHDRVPLEVMRGCMGGCRFCHAGFFYRPKRERSAADLQAWSVALMTASGDESLGLVSLSTADLSCLPELLTALSTHPVYPEQLLAVPSLRMNDRTLELLARSPNIKISGLTFAPEAGSQRLREVIGKRLSDDDIVSVIASTRASQYLTVKLYFMLGLPFETDADLLAMAELIRRLERECRRGRRRKSLSVSISAFVPKPFTPFQWAGQPPVAELVRRRKLVCQELVRCSARLSWRDERLCRLEAVLSRGDAAVGRVVRRAVELGCRFDGWNDQLDLGAWDRALADCGVDPDRYTEPLDPASPLPWDPIDLLVPRDFLLAEWRRAAALAAGTVAVPAGAGRIDGAVASDGTGATDSAGSAAVPSAGATAAAPTDTTSEVTRCRHGWRRETPVSRSATGPPAGDQAVDVKMDTETGQRFQPTVSRFRVTYARGGPSVFLSHLDVVRLLTRVVRRSGLAYGISAGMHQRPRLSFGPPLPLGHSSRGEVFDLGLVEVATAAEVANRVSLQLPVGFALIGVEPLSPNHRGIQAEAVGVVYRLGMVAASAHAGVVDFFADRGRTITVRKGDQETGLPLAAAVIWWRELPAAEWPTAETDPAWGRVRFAVEVGFRQGQAGVPSASRVLQALADLLAGEHDDEPLLVERVRILTGADAGLGPPAAGPPMGIAAVDQAAERYPGGDASSPDSRLPHED